MRYALEINMKQSAHYQVISTQPAKNKCQMSQ